MDASRVPDGVEDVDHRAWKLPEMSELERINKKGSNSPCMHTEAKCVVHNPGGNAHSPGSLHSTLGCPMSDRTQRFDDTSTLCRDEGPGGNVAEQVQLEVVEGNSDRQIVAEGAGYDE